MVWCGVAFGLLHRIDYGFNEKETNLSWLLPMIISFCIIAEIAAVPCAHLAIPVAWPLGGIGLERI